MIPSVVWMMFRGAIEKTVEALPEFGKHQRLESEAAIKRSMDRARRELQTTYTVAQKPDPAAMLLEFAWANWTENDDGTYTVTGVRKPVSPNH